MDLFYQHKMLEKQTTIYKRFNVSVFITSDCELVKYFA